MSSLKLRRMLRLTAASSAVLAVLLAAAPAVADETHLDDMARPVAAARFPAVAVGPQYDTTHVCVAPEDFDRFTDSFVATFGGKKSKQGVFQVTPTPSQTMSQLVLTP
ncbi:MAG: glyoxalase, partial [Burkholderia sp.]|nr:glyoxalase [Burkholderia sp.]